MKRNKRSVKNPLRRRILRELKGDWKKYIVVALFLIFMIGFISGMYVANGSMLTAADEAASKYRREDGHFILLNKADNEMIETLETKESLTIYENQFKDQKESWSEDISGTEKLSKAQRDSLEIRIFPIRQKVDLPCVMEGKLPEADNEIAIDRMHANNVGLKVGDTIKAGKRKLTITGLVSNPDYTTLFQNSSDMMFDALTFDVGLMTRKGFDQLSAQVHYNYAYIYSTEPGNGKFDRAGDEAEEKERADTLLETLVEQSFKYQNQVQDYVPAYANQAIQFTINDMGQDEAMGGVILYVLMIVLAFVFAITISNTITRESTVIGTLRASGYSRAELVCHYMATPLIVTLIGALIGNILGYTLFKNLVVDMYYNSYGLPVFKTVMSSEALIRTTLIPLAIMFVINLFVIVRKMHCTPLQFLRRDLKKNKRSKALRLPRFRFLSRFRLRVLLQNLPGYLILFVGICFVMLMMAMAVGMPDSLAYYKDRAPGMIIAPYETILKSSRNEWGQGLATDEKSAEKFIVSSMTYDTGQREEDIEAYGIDPDSSYIDTKELRKLGKNEVLISHSFAGKFKKESGDTIRLHAKYEDKTYTFKVKGIDPYEAASAVFMPIDESRDLFDMEEDDFSGWFSEKRIKDIDQKYILNEITAKDITKMVDQLDHSLGSYMVYFQYMCIALSVILMYLLTKLIIERNENAISMTKILGYSNREISSVYITATTIAVLISECVAVFIGYRVMSMLWKIILKRLNGWFDFIITKQGIAKMLIFVLIGYLIVMIFDFRRIRRIPMDQALKNVE